MLKKVGQFAALCFLFSVAVISCELDQCINGSVKCVMTDKYSICENNKWSSPNSCSGDKVCVWEQGEAKCRKQECEDGLFSCTEDGMQMSCENSQWTKPEPCQEGWYCHSKFCTQNICNHGKKQCKNGTQRDECINGLWQTTQCQNGEYCVGGECVECEDNEKRCVNEGKGRQVCHSGKWGGVEHCDETHICSNGQCILNECSDVVAMCDEGKIQYCVEHSWTVAENCEEENFSCHDGKCIPDVCSENTCEDGKVKPCKNGQYTSLQNCNENEACQNGVCKDRECTDGEKLCEGLRIKECINGFWGPVQDCPENYLCYSGDNAACVGKGSCDPNTSACTMNNEVVRCIKSGSSMTWGEPQRCISRSCVGVQCTDILNVPIISRYCNSTTSYYNPISIGPGPQGETVRCQSNEYCHDAKCKYCSPGVVFCFGNKLYKCNEINSPILHSECIDGCMNGNTQCNSCKPGNQYCDATANAILRCTGLAMSSFACPRGTTCNVTNNVARCLKN
ncbi:MAG: hypothetical protein ACOX8U_05355 [Bradymonadia bacterium]|jgi:hypothetical protein